jgi:hypothetical protein
MSVTSAAQAAVFATSLHVGTSLRDIVSFLSVIALHARSRVPTVIPLLPSVESAATVSFVITPLCFFANTRLLLKTTIAITERKTLEEDPY